MATSTGTATSYTDLWSKLVTFLTTNSTLVAASQNWAVAWGSGNEIVLQGPGLASDAQIFVGMKLVARPTPDEYEIQINGMTGVYADALTFDTHVNVSPAHVRLFLDSGPMTYWFIANGRRFVVVVKISTVFQAAYGGFMLPYAPPTNYAYPLFIGGSAGQQAGYSATSWRSTDVGHRHFPHSYLDSGGVSPRPASALLLSPDGDWLSCGALGNDANIAIGPRQFQSGLDTVQNASITGYGYVDIRKRMQKCFGDQLLLTRLSLNQAIPSDQAFGVLDGCYHVPGSGNSSENIITVGGVDHLVVQDCFRTSIDEYWAVALA